MIEQNVYPLVGGDETFRKVVDEFYTRVEADPVLRPLFPADLEPGKENQFLFLAQYFGGPPRYNALRGHPRLRMRHMPFVIGEQERNAWLGHMLEAIEAAGSCWPRYLAVSLPWSSGLNAIAPVPLRSVWSKRSVSGRRSNIL